MISFSLFSCSITPAASVELRLVDIGLEEVKIKPRGGGRRPPEVVDEEVLMESNPPPPAPIFMFKEGRGREGREDQDPPEFTEGPGEADPPGSRVGRVNAFILALMSSCLVFIFARWP